jgi:type II secretory pathway pseudopilin PulG
MMVAVIFTMALLVLSLAIAAPRIKEQIRRDREEETMARGKQYIRAIQLYYRKFHAYPPNIDALVKTQEIRFLRKKYTDPLTGKDDWKPIQFGQAKAPTAMGFFGQPLGGSTIAGIGPGGGNGLNGANGQPGSTSTFGSGGSGSGIFGSNGNPASPPGVGTGAAPGSTTGTGDPTGSGDPSANSGSGPGNGFGGQTFGGAGIIGFSPVGPKESILVYKKKNHYNEWEFVYDPISDQMTMGTGGAGSGAQPINGGTPGIGANPNQPGFGQPGIGNNPTQPSFGNNPTPTPSPNPAPTPQQ